MQEVQILIIFWSFIEYVLYMHIHVNNYALNFTRSWSWIKFGCTKISTSENLCIKILQATSRIKWIVYLAAPNVTFHLPTTIRSRWYFTINYSSFDTPIVCGYSNYKELKENRQCVALSLYINDWLPSVHGLIPPFVVKIVISDLEKTCRNTSICSFF